MIVYDNKISEIPGRMIINYPINTSLPLVSHIFPPWQRASWWPGPTSLWLRPTRHGRFDVPGAPSRASLAPASDPLHFCRWRSATLGAWKWRHRSHLVGKTRKEHWKKYLHETNKNNTYNFNVDFSSRNWNQNQNYHINYLYFYIFLHTHTNMLNTYYEHLWPSQALLVLAMVAVSCSTVFSPSLMS